MDKTEFQLRLFTQTVLQVNQVKMLFIQLLAVSLNFNKQVTNL